ncbi:MAG: hypothetical protein WDN25_26145 [Acetobacteraceae bacterium]
MQQVAQHRLEHVAHIDVGEVERDVAAAEHRRPGARRRRARADELPCPHHDFGGTDGSRGRAAAGQRDRLVGRIIRRPRRCQRLAGDLRDAGDRARRLLAWHVVAAGEHGDGKRRRGKPGPAPDRPGHRWLSDGFTSGIS